MRNPIIEKALIALVSLSILFAAFSILLPAFSYWSSYLSAILAFYSILLALVMVWQSKLGAQRVNTYYFLD